MNEPLPANLVNRWTLICYLESLGWDVEEAKIELTAKMRFYFRPLPESMELVKNEH